MPATLDRHSGSITALATVAIVVLTFYYVGYSKKQWQAVEQSNRISRESLASVQRAFVSFLDINPTVPVDGFNKKTGKVSFVQFFVSWQNSGTTPTRGARVHVKYDRTKDASLKT